MRIAAVAVIVCSLAGSLQSQQESPQESLDQIKQQLRELAVSLQQTRADLQDARREIQSLHATLDNMRSAREATPPASQADIPARVNDLEESQRITDARLEQQQQTKIESASKYPVKLSGMVLFNAGVNRGTVDNQDVPMLALHGQPGRVQGDVFGTMRQSLVGLQLFGPRVAGAKTTADVQFDFFGGTPGTLDSSAMGIVRLRTARARLDWDRWSLTFGQDQPFISPLSPTSLATLGTPGFGYSGNLWTWTPQIVAERRWRASDRDTLELQIGVLDPISGEPVPGISGGQIDVADFQNDRQPDAGERARVPAIAIHPVWKRGEGDQALSIGAGGYFARQNYGFYRTVDAWAGTIDWNIPVTRMLILSGELYRGRALGGLWGGIGQSVVYTGSTDGGYSAVRGINSMGGWSQIKFRPSQRWEFNGAFGEDSPFAADLRLAIGNPANPYSGFMRNRTTMVNVIQRPKSNLLLSLEYRHLNTVQSDGSTRTAEHVNLGIGLQF